MLPVSSDGGVDGLLHIGTVEVDLETWGGVVAWVYDAEYGERVGAGFAVKTLVLVLIYVFRAFLEWKLFRGMNIEYWWKTTYEMW